MEITLSMVRNFIDFVEGQGSVSELELARRISATARGGPRLLKLIEEVIALSDEVPCEAIETWLKNGRAFTELQAAAPKDGITPGDGSKERPVRLKRVQ